MINNVFSSAEYWTSPHQIWVVYLFVFPPNLYNEEFRTALRQRELKSTKKITQMCYKLVLNLEFVDWKARWKGYISRWHKNLFVMC